MIYKWWKMIMNGGNQENLGEHARQRIKLKRTQVEKEKKKLEKT